LKDQSAQIAFKKTERKQNLVPKRNRHQPASELPLLPQRLLLLQTQQKPKDRLTLPGFAFPPQLESHANSFSSRINTTTKQNLFFKNLGVG
jgi:hypothetical protein